jgi:regulator of sigma E protease
MVGVQPGNVVPLETRRYGFVSGAVRATKVCWQHSTAIFRFLGALVTGSIAPRNLAGPVGIVQMSGRAAQEGFSALIDFMALISINLGILNLMPLVVTDGGRLVELAFEKVRGRRANRRFMEILTNIVVYAFLALALYVTFHDVLRVPMFLR